ncbi:MAG: hypothetical protein QOH17_3349, partial [Pseudonocardiales bacterium]|nr:hypothetical protein [Pseudonocardiales bacterium]
TWHQEFFAAVERWPWLATLNDSVSGVVQPVYDRFRGNLAVELLHGGRWAGHALHPALSDLPIGFWSGSLLLDVVNKDNAADGGKWGPAATLSAAGIAAAVATATTGVADWTVSDNEDRRVGLFHGLLNGAAMVLQSASLAARLAGRRTPAVGLGAASMAVTAAAGFVGGHLVQGRGAMVNRVAANAGPTRWVKTMAEDDLVDGEPKGVDVEGRKVLLYRDHGTVYAIDDLCSHAGALLSRGPVVNCVVTCPLHESQFDVRDGHIVRGPAHHPQPALPARVRNGWVEIRGSQPVKRRART